MTFQESTVLKMLVDRYKLPITNFWRKELFFYKRNRKNTQNGFIGCQVPYEYKLSNGSYKTFWSDFSIYIPNKLDVRIECKSLDVKNGGTLMRSVLEENDRLTKSIIEKRMIFLCEGDGFNDNEFIDRIKKQNSLFVFNIDELLKAVCF